jgi:hypothetical protein
MKESWHTVYYVIKVGDYYFEDADEDLYYEDDEPNYTFTDNIKNAYIFYDLSDIMEYEIGQRLVNKSTKEKVIINAINPETSPVGEILCFELKPLKKNRFGDYSPYYITQTTLEEYFEIDKN